MPSGRDWLILLNITYKKTKSVITTVLAFLLTNLLSTIHYSLIFREIMYLCNREIITRKLSIIHYYQSCLTENDVYH